MTRWVRTVLASLAEGDLVADALATFPTLKPEEVQAAMHSLRRRPKRISRFQPLGKFPSTFVLDKHSEIRDLF